MKTFTLPEQVHSSDRKGPAQPTDSRSGGRSPRPRLDRGPVNSASCVSSPGVGARIQSPARPPWVAAMSVRIDPMGTDLGQAVSREFADLTANDSSLLKACRRSPSGGFSNGSEDKLFFATATGLKILDSGHWRSVSSPGRDSANIFAVPRRSIGAKVLGRHLRGLILSARSEFRSFAASDFQARLLSFCAIVLQRLWIGTNNGVLRWGRRELAGIFTVLTGLSGRETQPRSCPGRYGGQDLDRPPIKASSIYREHWGSSARRDCPHQNSAQSKPVD